MSFSPSAAVYFLSKIMFKKKIDFFPLKWAMVESGLKEIGGYITLKNTRKFHCYIPINSAKLICKIFSSDKNFTLETVYKK